MYELATNAWAKFFFCAWYVFSVFTLMNIFVGFILDSYDELVEHKNREKLREALKDAQNLVREYHHLHHIEREEKVHHLEEENLDELSDHHDEHRHEHGHHGDL